MLINNGMENGSGNFRKAKILQKCCAVHRGRNQLDSKLEGKEVGERDSGWRFIEFCIGEGQKVEIT